MIILTQTTEETEIITCEELQVRHNQLVELYSQTFVEKLHFLGLSAVMAIIILILIACWMADRASFKEKLRKAKR